LIPHYIYPHGGFLLPYDTSLNSGWSCVLSENSVDFAIYNLTVTVFEAANPAMTHVRSKSATFVSGMVH
jgi:hypothetical protein